MNTLCIAVLVTVVAATQAGLIGLGAGLDSAAVLTGPAGVVARTGLAGAVVAPGLGLGHGILGLGLGGLVVPAGSGLEGQWIPDINEKLYDDGSYKPQIYGL